MFKLKNEQPYSVSKDAKKPKLLIKIIVLVSILFCLKNVLSSEYFNSFLFLGSAFFSLILLKMFKYFKVKPYLFLAFSMLPFFGVIYFIGIQQRVALIVICVSLFPILNFILSSALGIKLKSNK